VDTAEARTRENIVACLGQAGQIHPAEVIAEEDRDLTGTVEDNTDDLWIDRVNHEVARGAKNLWGTRVAGGGRHDGGVCVAKVIDVKFTIPDQVC
jgi:hypothetical protein